MCFNFAMLKAFQIKVYYDREQGYLSVYTQYKNFMKGLSSYFRKHHAKNWCEICPRKTAKTLVNDLAMSRAEFQRRQSLETFTEKFTRKPKAGAWKMLVTDP